MTGNAKDPTTDDERPPLGLSWAALYLIVLASLVVWIALFSLFTKVFR